MRFDDLGAQVARLTERVSLLAEILIRTQQHFIYLAEAATKANEAFVTLNRGLQDVYSQLPRVLSGFASLSQSVEATTKAFVDLATASTSAGEAIYSSVIASSIQAGNAANLLTGSIEGVSRTFAAAGQAAAAAGEAVQTASSIFERAIDALTTPFAVASESINQLSASAEKSIQSMREALVLPFAGIENIFGESYRNATRGLTELQNRVEQFTSAVNSRFSSLAESSNAFLDGIRHINLSFMRIGQTLGEYYETQVRRVVASVQRELAAISRELAPLVTELRRMQMGVQAATIVLGAALNILTTLFNALSQLLGVLGRFVGSWLQSIQILAQTQQTMNILAVQVQDLSSATTEGVEAFNAYSKSLNLVSEVAARTNVSLSALSDAMQYLSGAAIVPSTRLMRDLVDTADLLARRLGILPDEAMRMTEAFLSGQAALGRFLPALARGGFEAWLYAQFGLLQLPQPLEVQARLQFLRTVVPTLLGGEAPATLVQFVQALHTLGQQFRTIFAEAAPVGGVRLLEEIRNLLRELVEGEIGRNLRQFFTFISTGIANAVRSLLDGMRAIFASPQFLEIGRGVGILIQAIGSAFQRILGGLLQNLGIEQIRNFFVNMGANVAGFIVAAATLIPRIFSAISEFVRNITGGGGILNFFSTILILLTQGIRIGIMIFDLVFKTASAVFQAIQPMLERMDRLVRNAEIVSASIRLLVSLFATFLTITAGSVVQGPMGAVLGTLTGVAMVGGAYRDLMSALRGGGLATTLGDVGAELKQEWDALRGEIAQVKEQVAALAPGFPNIQQHLQTFAMSISEAGQAAQTAFIQTTQEVRETLGAAAAQWASAASESGNQLRRLTYQYIENIVMFVWRGLEPFVTAGRRLGVLAPMGGFAPIAPFGVPLALPAPGGAFALGGITPAVAAAVTTAALREQLRYDIAALQQLVALRGVGVAIPEGAIERLRDRILRAMEEILGAINQGINETLQNLQTRVDTIMNIIRLRIITGTASIGDMFKGYIQAMEVALATLRETSFQLGQLIAMRYLYPGIENTVAYAQALNQAIEGAARNMEKFAESFIRVFELARRWISTLAEISTVLAGWGISIQSVMDNLDAFIRGTPQEAMRRVVINMMQVVRGSAEAVVTQFIGAARSAFAALRTEVAALFADAFTQLLRGNVEGFMQAVQSALARVFEVGSEYMQRMRRLMETYLTPVRVVRENFDELRGLLSTIGAEVALFPYAINNLLPALMEARNITLRWMQDAMALGDILMFREAHRSLIQIQRQIMELLGLGGMFLPAFTPEQMVRMLVRLGAPTAREAAELARGRTLMEPAGFRAVPIPLAMLYGIPYAPGLMFRPDIFTGFAAALQGMGAITPAAVWGQFHQMATEAVVEAQRGIGQLLGGGRPFLRGIPELVSGVQAGFAAALNVSIEPLRGEISRISSTVQQIYELMRSAYMGEWYRRVAGLSSGAIPLPWGVTMPGWSTMPAMGGGINITLPALNISIPINLEATLPSGEILSQRQMYLILSNRSPVGR